MGDGSADPDRFAAALFAVRTLLRDGAVAPEAVLNVEGLAQQLRMSATPVREALAFLAGQGLAERRGRGYRARALAPDDVRELLRLHLAYVGLLLQTDRAGEGGLHSDGRTRPEQDLASSPYGERTERLWMDLAALSGRARIGQGLRAIADQLAPVRRVEPVILADVEAELEALSRGRFSGDPGAFAAAVRAYHARRVQAAAQLSAAVYWDEGAGKI